MEENVQRKSYANVTNKVEKDLLHFRNTMQNIAEVHNNISWQKYFTIFIFSRDFSIGGWFLGQLHRGKLPLTTKLTLIITLTGGQLSSRGIVRIPVGCLPSKFMKSRFHHRRRNMFQCTFFYRYIIGFAVTTKNDSFVLKMSSVNVNNYAAVYEFCCI